MEQFSDQMEDQAGAKLLDDNFHSPYESHFDNALESIRSVSGTADAEKDESSVHQGYCHESLPL